MFAQFRSFEALSEPDKSRRLFTAGSVLPSSHS
jgi:hypothetical protein